MELPLPLGHARESTIAALDDAPAGLEELRATLTEEAARRQREGL